MFGLDCRLDRIQGRRTVFVFRNPIIKTLCATVGFSDVTSANVVGYQNKTDTRKSLNYVTATFRTVGGGNNSIQDIQLDDSVANLAANFQRLTAGAGSACQYMWYTIAGAKTVGLDVSAYEDRNGVWIIYTPGTRTTPAKYELPTGEDAILKVGEGIQIDLPTAENTVLFNGEVSDKDIVQFSRKALNYIGNPYPADCEIQDFQIDKSVANLAANFQRLTAGAGSACQYMWYTIAGAKTVGLDVSKYEADPDSYNGVWIIYTAGTRTKPATYALPTGEDAVVTAGSAVQIDMPAADLEMRVLSPIEL